MNTYGQGLFFGIAFAVLLVVVWSVIRKLNGKEYMDKYDERQLLARSRAYQAGFFTFMAGIMLDACMKLFGISVFEDPTGEFAALFAALIVFEVIAIRHDAFLGLNRKWKSQVILYAVITGLQLLNTVRAVQDGDLVHNGRLTLQCVSPMCMVTFGVVLAAMLLHHYSEAREMQEDLS